MTLYTDPNYSRVMVFIDYRNVYNSVRYLDDSLTMDLTALVKRLVGARNLVGAYVFDARKMYTDGTDETIMMHNRLKEQGFRVIARESLVHNDGHTEQKEVDVAMTCEILEHAMSNHYDVAIVISGDRDFIPVIQKVQSAGKRVEVAAFDDVFNEETRRSSDRFYRLNEVPFMEMSSPFTPSGGDVDE